MISRVNKHRHTVAHLVITPTLYAFEFGRDAFISVLQILFQTLPGFRHHRFELPTFLPIDLFGSAVHKLFDEVQLKARVLELRRDAGSARDNRP